MPIFFKNLIYTILLLSACFSTVYANPPIIMGYWESWGTYYGFSMPGSTQPNEIMRGQLTGLNAVTYSFLEVNPNGVLSFTDPWSDLTSNHANDVAFCQASPESCPAFKADSGGIGNFDAFLNTSLEHHIFAIGGAQHDDTFENAFKHPEQFIKSLGLLLTYFPNITGIDLDYEPVGGIPTQNIAPFISLIQQIKKEFPKLHVSYTLIANHNNIRNLGADNWTKLIASLDYVGVMGYDFHGVFDKQRPSTALHSSLYNAEDDFSIDRAIHTLNDMGVPNHKILLGMPTYGRAVGGVQQSGLKQAFTSSVKGDLDDVNCSTNFTAINMCAGLISYHDLIFNYPKSSTVYVQNKATGAYSYFGEQQLFVSYDNKESAIEKARYVKENKLAGIFFWSLRSDLKVTHPESLLTAVAAVFGIKIYQPPRLDTPKLYSYYAGWYPAQGAAPIPDFKMDGVILAFATVQKNGNNYVTTYSGEFNQPSSDPLKSYTVWNNWVRKYFNAGARAYVSYGGGTNEQLRNYIINGNQADLSALANEVQRNVAQNYFDGIDLDIEGWWLHSKEENIKFANNLASFVKLLRAALDADPYTREKPIMLAMGWESAGQVKGMTDQTNTAYAGTMQPFFANNQAMKAVKAIFIMSYNINIPNFYARQDLVGNILNTFVEVGVPEEKLIFGIQPYQKGNEAATALNTVQALGDFIKHSNYGGLFMWGIGTQGLGGGNQPYLSAYDYLHAMKVGMDIK